MYHIFSTMANSTKYIKYRQAPQKDLNIAERSVLIKGGSGMHQKHLGTPLGVHTAVSDEDMDWLKDDLHFKQHMTKGYITVRKAEVNPEVAAAEMITHDPKTDACPVIPQDFKDDDKKETIKPMANKKKAA
ncbi:hypothetical protein [Fimbriiglobus ruber]|uniref:Phage protein n=1 Tax=Fimbriiglobus ruber TaxID=1908690 RepID=A0A225DEX6_9BACT|nr:hypothetical protein [Fimbriiglobus ruber]OWK39543.1 Phage protein [Fimbriiglobus ruber]